MLRCATSCRTLTGTAVAAALRFKSHLYPGRGKRILRRSGFWNSLALAHERTGRLNADSNNRRQPTSLPPLHIVEAVRLKLGIMSK